ncbi:type II secretion system protein GspJ [Trichlorobacter lovleyi]|uniref:Type II secretion system protein J n=1 Tax=Trichlorobacter lovleyi (strain ATCC BAA-1151 / DSM 17278 / SZ) TaxID=398767 RepID=B3E7L5_TRIL1|nr:type II secretion system protein GspJ [Trichlorobacter lovleyi]ACD94997.1 N-terminal methylation [Trichlorobacter lovleyi SZ]
MTANNRRGFTLLELLIALAIATLVITAAYATLFSLNRAHEVASQGMEQRRVLRSTLDMLRRELASLRYFSDDSRLRFVVEDRDYFGKPASTLTFSTLAAPTPAPVSDQLRVRYRIDTSRERLSLTKASQDLLLEGDEPKAYPLLDELEGFLVECSDGNRWLKTWDTELTKAVPKLIRITIRLREGGQTVAYQATVKPRITSR